MFRDKCSNWWKDHRSEQCLIIIIARLQLVLNQKVIICVRVGEGRQIMQMFNCMNNTRGLTWTEETGICFVVLGVAFFSDLWCIYTNRDRDRYYGYSTQWHWCFGEVWAPPHNSIQAIFISLGISLCLCQCGCTVTPQSCIAKAGYLTWYPFCMCSWFTVSFIPGIWYTSLR